MNPAVENSRLLVSGTIMDLLALQKQRRKAIQEIEANVFPDDGKTAAQCYRAALHLHRQQAETGREIQTLLEALSAMPTSPKDGTVPGDGREGFAA